MRKQRTCARWLPAQRRQSAGWDLEQHQLLLGGEMPGDGALQLRAPRQVDEAVGEVVRAAVEPPRAAQRLPFGGSQHLVDEEPVVRRAAQAASFPSSCSIAETILGSSG